MNLRGLCLLALLPATAHAQYIDPDARGAGQPSEGVTETTPPAEPEALAEAVPDWEAALGAVLSYQPAYAGANEQVWKVRPAFLLRYKRLAISNTAGMTTRRSRDVMSGLSYDLVDTSRWRAGVSLRYDQGRDDGDSAWLNGVGDVAATLRARLSASYALTPTWRLASSWSQDMLRRGGGGVGDVGLQWEQRDNWLPGGLPPLTLGAGVGVSFANGQYMRAFYGINAAQSVASGHPVYEPGAGLRSVSLSLGLRGDVTAEWGMMVGASASRQLGPAARSPLTLTPTGWSVSAGVIRRF